MRALAMDNCHGDLFAQRLREGLSRRLRPHGPVTISGLARLGPFARSTVDDWKCGRRGLTLLQLHRLDQICTEAGAPGLFAEVVAPGLAPQSRSWSSERLPLDSLKDRPRGQLLSAWRSGADPVEAASSLGLLPQATILTEVNGDFISAWVGTAAYVDRSVIGRSLLDRKDRDYAGLVHAQMMSTRGEPTLYRLRSGGNSYSRLALPGERLIITVPYDQVAEPGFRVS